MADHLPAPVVVLGLGKMGAAMARRLRDLGHPLIVWNRSFHKAGALAAEKTDGAKVMAARTAEEALLMGREEDGSGPLILSVLSDTDTTVALLTDPVVLPLLTGRVVVNLASGSPDDGRMVAAKLDGKGLLAYVDGAFSGPPQKARGGAGVVFASCENAAVFKSHCGLLAGLGKVVFTGRIGSSRALDYAVVDLALVNLMALASNTAMLEREGVNTDQLFASLEHRFATMPAYLRGNYEKMDQVSPLPKGDRDVAYRNEPVATLATWRNFWASRLPYLKDRKLPSQLAQFVISLLDEAGARNEPDADVSRVQEAVRFAKL